MKKEIKKLQNGMKKEIKNIITNFIFSVLVLFSVVFFYKNILLTCTLLIIFCTIWLIKWKSYKTLLIFLIGAIFGSIFEMISVQFGAWTYTSNSIFGVPYWLFLVWGAAAAFIYQIAKEIKRIGIKDKIK